MSGLVHRNPAMAVAIIALVFSTIGTATATQVLIKGGATSAKAKKKKTNRVSLPSGAVSFFNLSACPSGWTELTAARGRYLVGVPTGGTLASTVGTALSNTENRPVGQHNHGITDPAHDHDTNVVVFDGAPSGGGNPFDAAGTFGAGADTDDATTGITVNNSTGTGGVTGTNAPYIQLRVCQKT